MRYPVVPLSTAVIPKWGFAVNVKDIWGCIDSVIIVLFILILKHQLSLLLVDLLSLLDQFVNIIGLVDIDQAELLKIDIRSVVKINQIVNFFVVSKWHRDSAEFKALDKLLELHLTIEIKVKVPECDSVISELLLKPLMDLP